MSVPHLNDSSASFNSSTTYLRPPPPRLESTLSKVKNVLRQPMAEFAGVCIFVVVGTAVNCQVTLSTNPDIASSPRGDFLSVGFGWAAGLAMGAWVSGGISGGHLNPAVTLALAAWRDFPWHKVPGYIFAQVLGGTVGAAIVYGNYARAIQIFEGLHASHTRATAGLFATFALDYMKNISCFFVEFLGTALLVLMVLAATDKKNNAPPTGMLPVALFITLLGLSLGLGMQTSFAFNPARDFGPRLLLTFAGYGKQLYTYRHQYWLWCPIIAPIAGAQVSAAFYNLCISTSSTTEDDQTDIESHKPFTSQA